MKKKSFFCLLSFILLFSSLIFVETAFAQGLEKKILKILVPRSTSSLPILLLAKNDPIPGVDIQAESFINHAQALTMLFRGEVDLLLTGTSQGWQNRLNQGPIVMINTGVWGVSYLIGKDHRIKGFSDLRGKRIALPFPGSPLDFQTRYILVKEGLDPEKDLQIIYCPFSQAVPRLLLGQIDVAPLPEPLATKLVVEKGLLRLIDYKEAWAGVSEGEKKSPQVSLFSTESFIQTEKRIIIELVNQWRNSSKEVQENPGQAALLFSDFLSLPAEVVRQAIGNTLYFVPTIEENREMVIQYFNEVQSLLPGKKQLLDNGFFFRP